MAALTLYFDSACPFCRREMARLRRWDRPGRLAFVDIAAPGFDPAPLGTTLAAMNAELHGLRTDGAMLVGTATILEAYTGGACLAGMAAASAGAAADAGLGLSRLRPQPLSLFALAQDRWRPSHLRWRPLRNLFRRQRWSVNGWCAGCTPAPLHTCWSAWRCRGLPMPLPWTGI